MAIAYRMVGRYDKAIGYLEKGNQRFPNHLFSHLNLSACYILADREEEARAEAKEVLRINPDFSLD
jgi:tetratricopeptide (TPR) repeat protein